MHDGWKLEPAESGPLPHCQDHQSMSTWREGGSNEEVNRRRKSAMSGCLRWKQTQSNGVRQSGSVGTGNGLTLGSANAPKAEAD